ncbi:MAG: inorganic diphosphatase [Neomegalonema sp.]|nr:inorganic diphosphatase [Neomegalonema sp.]
MDLSKISPGANPPHDVNVVVEIMGGAHGGLPVKYEIDKDSGALFVDRLVTTAMFYPFNYGFVPQTLAEDGDPTDVLVRTHVEIAPGAVIRCRLIGVLRTEDESGPDDKLIAVPVDKVDPFQAHIRKLEDLPPKELERIYHFFEHHKDLEDGKWVKLKDWGNADEAGEILMKSIAANNAQS